MHLQWSYWCLLKMHAIFFMIYILLESLLTIISSNLLMALIDPPLIYTFFPNHQQWLLWLKIIPYYQLYILIQLNTFIVKIHSIHFFKQLFILLKFFPNCHSTHKLPVHLFFTLFINIVCIKRKIQTLLLHLIMQFLKNTMTYTSSNCLLLYAAMSSSPCHLTH